MANSIKNKVGIDLLMGTIGLFVMTICVLAGIFFRAWGRPLLWTEEVAKWMMAWITFAGASYSFKNGGLLRVDYFTRTFFNEKQRRIIDIFAMLLLFLFFIYTAVSSAYYILATIARKQVFPVTRVPFAVIIASLFVGAVLTSIYSLKEMHVLLKQGYEKG